MRRIITLHRLSKHKFLAIFLFISLTSVQRIHTKSCYNQYFVYDGSTGNQFDPSHYTEILGSEINNFTDLTGLLKIIRVNWPDEVYQDGLYLGKPKVDFNDYSSTIQADLSGSQVSGGSSFLKIANRIWVAPD